MKLYILRRAKKLNKYKIKVTNFKGLIVKNNRKKIKCHCCCGKRPHNIIWFIYCYCRTYMVPVKEVLYLIYHMYKLYSAYNCFCQMKYKNLTLIKSINASINTNINKLIWILGLTKHSLLKFVWILVKDKTYLLLSSQFKKFIASLIKILVSWRNLC